jgi:transposase
VFEDEFGMSYTEPVSFTWAPRGQTPCFKRIGKYRRETSTMVGLTISGSIFKRHFDGSVNAEKLIVGLAHFQRHIRRPIIVIWDRSPIHRAKIVQTYLANHADLHQEFLPAYAPEVNPEEYCHGNVKRSLRNAIFTSKGEIRQHLDRGFARLRKRHDILLGLFHHAGLQLKQLW